MRASAAGFASPSTPIPPRHRLLLALLSLTLLLIALLPRDLWSTDEAIVGAVIWEMAVQGAWLVPHVNGEIYADKPPLYYWLATLPAMADRLTPLWFRLPGALAAIGCLWLTYGLGARLFRPATGLLAAVILATSPLFTISAQVARMDMLLTLLVTAMLYCFARGMQASPEQSRRWFLAIYPLAGLAFLTKALIGPVMAGLVIGGVLLWQREWRTWWRLQPGWGLLLAAAVVLPWLIPAVRQEGVDYAHALLITQSVGRAVQSFAHDRPFYYYVYAFPPTALPWIFFLPGALWWQWQRWDRLDWRRPFFLAWTVGLFLFLSAISGKLVIYLLPLFPAVALIVAELWREALTADEAFNRRWLLWPALFGVAALTGVALVAPIALPLPPALPPMLFYGYAAAVVLVSIISLRFIRRPLSHRLLTMVLAAIVLMSGLVQYGAAAINDLMSPKTLAESLQTYHDRVAAMATYKVRPGLLNYYAQRRFDILPDPAAVRAFFAQPAPAIGVLREQDLPKIWAQFPPELRLIDRRRIGRVAYAVIANAPAAQATAAPR